MTASPELQRRATVFIRRELWAWPNIDIEFLTTYSVSIMKAIDIRSDGAIRLLSDFLGPDGAEHLTHEVCAYLRSPYKDLAAYDAVVQYDDPGRSSPPPSPGRRPLRRDDRSYRPSKRSLSNAREDQRRARARPNTLENLKSEPTVAQSGSCKGKERERIASTFGADGALPAAGKGPRPLFAERNSVPDNGRLTVDETRTQSKQGARDETTNGDTAPGRRDVINLRARLLARVDEEKRLASSSMPPVASVNGGGGDLDDEEEESRKPKSAPVPLPDANDKREQIRARLLAKLAAEREASGHDVQAQSKDASKPHGTSSGEGSEQIVTHAPIADKDLFVETNRDVEANTTVDEDLAARQAALRARVLLSKPDRANGRGEEEREEERMRARVRESRLRHLLLSEKKRSQAQESRAGA